MYTEAMSLRLVVNDDRPSGFWMLDDQYAPFVDSSGYENTAPTNIQWTNLLLNPSAETNASFVLGNRVTITRSNEWASSGDYSFKCTRTADVSPDAFLDIDANTLVSSGRLKTNTVYTMIGTVKQTALIAGVAEGSNVGMAQRKSLFVHLNGTGIGTVSGNNTIGVQTLTYTFTTPSSLAGYNSMRFYTGGAVGDVFYWDSLMLVEGTYTGSYFDGSTAGGTWTGTAHASTSTKYEPFNFHSALANDAVRAPIVSGTQRITYASTIYNKLNEDASFTMEGWARSIKVDPTSVAAQQILGNNGALDGMLIAGTVVSFVTKYTNTGEARCSFDLQENYAFHWVCVHTPVKNSLYINGELVAEVDITIEQQADTFLNNGTTLSSGATSGPNKLAINGIAFYRFALEDEAIDEHYAFGTDNLSDMNVVSAFKGAHGSFEPYYGVPHYSIGFNTEAEWRRGRFTNTAVEFDQLVPQQRSNVSVAGSWDSVIPLPENIGTLYAINLVWDGEGATVDVSLNGTSWTPAARGVNLSIIPQGFNPVGRLLQVRVSFPGGITDDESYIDGLTAAIYNTAKIIPIDGRAVTLDKVSIELDSDALEYQENWGSEINDGSIVIAQRTVDSMLPKTIQIWAKKKSAAVFTDNMNASATTYYSNDGPQRPYQIDEWQLRTYTFNDGFNSGITISGSGQVAMIALYPYVMTAQQVKDSYLSYVGKPVLNLTSIDTINIVDQPELVDISEYDWAIESAG